MKKIVSVLCTIVAVFTLVGCQELTPTTKKSEFFTDPVLVYRIGLYVGEGGVQVEELEQFTELYLPGFGIKDLTGLQYLVNLEKLDLGENKIKDLSPLAGLTRLQFLSLDKNEIEDVAPLSGLTNLKVLHLSRNQIKDVSPLSSLVNLETLSLRGNPVGNISALEGLPASANVTWDGNLTP